MDLQEQKEITRKNLQRVLNELPKLAEKMPEIRRDFNMGVYGVYNSLEKESLSECKTVGCLLGNAARVFKDEFTEDLFSEYGFWYSLFAGKYFPYLYGINNYLRRDYLFSENWANTKFNDLNSALQRIKNLLENDLECKDFDFKTNQIIN